MSKCSRAQQVRRGMRSTLLDGDPRAHPSHRAWPWRAVRPFLARTPEVRIVGINVVEPALHGSMGNRIRIWRPINYAWLTWDCISKSVDCVSRNGRFQRELSSVGGEGAMTILRHHTLARRSIVTRRAEQRIYWLVFGRPGFSADVGCRSSLYRRCINIQISQVPS